MSSLGRECVLRGLSGQPGALVVASGGVGGAVVDGAVTAR